MKEIKFTRQRFIGKEFSKRTLLIYTLLILFVVSVPRNLFASLNNANGNDAVYPKVLTIGLLPGNPNILRELYEIQQKQITGTVTDEKRNPLAGVSIAVKGTSRGTFSDVKGFYRIEPENAQAILVFSFIGYKSQEVTVGNMTQINITLSEEIVGLDEVIVIGYGTAKKSDLTGSVSRIEGEAIKIQAPTQVVESLSGTVAGLYSIQSSSAAGGGTMEIRGPSSLSAGTDPMIVLDGVVYNGSIRDINPSDIQSIDVLKDASSAAVFGSKAASGIILITTTKGRKGKPTVNFTSKIGVSVTTNDLKPYGPKEYVDMHRDYLREIFTNNPPYFYFHPDDLPANISIQEWRNYVSSPAADNTDEWMGRIGMWPIERENYKAGKVTDFYSLCIKPGIRQDYNLSVGGATEDIQYYWSIGYLNNEGVIVGDEFSTIRSRLNLDLKVTDWFNIGTTTQFSYRDESVVQADLGALRTSSPYGSMWNNDGTPRELPNDYFGNPLMDYYGQDRLTNSYTLFSSLFAQIKLPFGFNYKISYQPRFSFSKNFNFWDSSTSTGKSNVNGYGSRVEASLYEWMLDNLLTWKKEIGIHIFDLTLLVNAERLKDWSGTHSNATFAPNQNLMYHALQFGSKPSVSDNDSQRSADALMGRLNYTLLGRYLFTGSIRRDGYSAFGQDNSRATFPALAFAWQISEEPFYKSSWMNRLKLRLSWGVNGNRDIGVYSALARLGSVLGDDNINILSGVYNTTLANPGLRWERTVSNNIGFDIGLFNDRIDMSFDAYKSKTNDLLMFRQLPRITGFTSITTNLGELDNSGFEASINTINFSNNKLTWKSNLNFSLNRNKIKKLWGNFGNYKLLNEDRYGELPDFTNKWFSGEARDVLWDYEITGIWQLDEATAAAVYNLKPGDFKPTDVNSDGKYLQLDDKKFIGYSDPRYRIGFSNEVTFLKNFSALLFIRADIGHMRELAYITYNRSTLGRGNTWATPYWSPEHPSNEWPRNTYPENYGVFEGGIRYFKPTGFLRVQDFSLSYNLPVSVAQRFKLNSVKVFGNIRNLFTLTKWPGFDPESGMTPMPKVFTFGLDLSM